MCSAEVLLFFSGYACCLGNFSWCNVYQTESQRYGCEVGTVSGQILADPANRNQPLPMHFSPSLLPRPTLILPRDPHPQTTWGTAYSQRLCLLALTLADWRRTCSGGGQPLHVCYHHRGALALPQCHPASLMSAELGSWFATKEQVPVSTEVKVGDGKGTLHQPCQTHRLPASLGSSWSGLSLFFRIRTYPPSVFP